VPPTTLHDEEPVLVTLSGFRAVQLGIPIPSTTGADLALNQSPGSRSMEEIHQADEDIWGSKLIELVA
jgi:hypothetical protein